jgi:hypothetical protein
MTDVDGISAGASAPRGSGPSGDGVPGYGAAMGRGGNGAIGTADGALRDGDGERDAAGARPVLITGGRGSSGATSPIGCCARGAR